MAVLLLLLLCGLLVSSVTGQQVDNEWVDPYDPFNYDTRNPTESQYEHVATKRREFTDEASQVQLSECTAQVVDLQNKIKEQRQKLSVLSEQPSCNPVFRRFLSRLLNEMQKVGLPTDSSDAVFDAKVHISNQAIKEIQALLDGEENWRTGALDVAIGQILVNFKSHDYDAWKWRFEDTFGVELDTLLKIAVCILITVSIICTQLWSTVSWFVQFSRLFAVCFAVSLVWNWFYLYKIAFAEHQNNIVKMDSFNGKCTGVRKMDWSDSLKEFFRSTLTLQDDPCKKYYEVLMVNPILLVPPTKAISVTITTFITEPMKHIGQGISEFLRALLKDLPITLQIPVLLTIILAIVVFMYGSVQAAFRHGITAPLRRHRRAPPPPGIQQLQPQPRALNGRGNAGNAAAGNAAAGNAPAGNAPAGNAAAGNAQQPGPTQPADTGTQVRRRNPNTTGADHKRVVAETLRAAAPPRPEDEADVEHQEGGGGGGVEDQTVTPVTEVEKQGEKKEEPAAAVAAAASPPPANTKTPPKAKRMRVCENRAHDEPSSDAQPSLRDAQVPKALEEHRTASVNVTSIETLGAPVQESCPEPRE